MKPEEAPVDCLGGPWRLLPVHVVVEVSIGSGAAKRAAAGAPLHPEATAGDAPH